MAHLTAEQIKKLNGVADEDRASLLEMLESLTKSNDDITALRKSQPTDSQQVVEKVKWEEMERAVAERDGKLSALEAKLASLNLDPDEYGGAFAPIFALFSGDK